MGMILDSCVWIGLASNQVNRQAVIEVAGNLPVFISVVSLGELSFGVEYGDHLIPPIMHNLRFE